MPAGSFTASSTARAVTFAGVMRILPRHIRLIEVPMRTLALVNAILNPRDEGILGGVLQSNDEFFWS